MEQANVTMAMLQTMANATQLPKAGKGGETDEFQKLLEEKSQAKDPLLEERPKTEGKGKTEATAPKKDKAPAEKTENTLEQVKKLAEQGYAVTQPNMAYYQPETGQVLMPGSYVQAELDGTRVLIPVAGLDEGQMRQLQQLVDGAAGAPAADVSDPQADAMLEATDPTVEHGPAQLLEEVVSQEAGQTIQQAVKELQPQEEDGEDSQVEITDAEQAPQQIFHDVEAAPVKVGETYDLEQTDGADAAEQIDAAVAQALQKGESTVSVRLTPENLGEVTVQVSMKSGGVLAVAISARNDDTRALLERHASHLEELLGSRVRESVQVEIQRQPESQQNQNQQQSYDGHNGHAQDGREQQRRSRREHTSAQDFMQQLRLGLIPADGEF